MLAQSTHNTRLIKDAVVVLVADACNSVGHDTAVTSPVVALFIGSDLGVAKTRAGTANLLVVLLLDGEGETITATTEAQWRLEGNWKEVAAR